MVFPFSKQRDVMECGSACLKMISDHFVRTIRSIVSPKNQTTCVKFFPFKLVLNEQH